MKLRKEQTVLLVTVVLLGLFFWNGLRAEAPRVGRSRGSAVELEHYATPDISRAQPEPRDVDASNRDLFQPPRDTRPLPRLDFEAPPIPPGTALRPPPVPGVAPNWYGRLLRADATPKRVPDLFSEAGAAGGGGALDDDFTDSEASDESALSVLEELGAATRRDEGDLSPDERAARLAGWKKLHDWLRVNEGDPLFGRIENPDRFGLAERPAEAILFVDIDPTTGAERFPGQQAGSFDRARVLEFGFADTASNRIQVRRREFDRAISPSVYADLLSFADECVAVRLEAREALDVAEEMYRRAAEFDADDPTPVLGLARCYEAGFRFEAAHDTYTALLERFEHRPEVHVRLAQLEARLRLFASAEARLRRADRLGRASWSVQHALGRFLLDRGRHAEAAEHLREAAKHEPKDPYLGHVRAGIRADLAAALLRGGALDEAADWFERAIQADPTHQAAEAGRRSCVLLGVDPSRFGEAWTGDAGFETLLNQGLAALERGEAVAARDALELAAESDPLRASQAWRAMSWLAEVSGYPEEALGFIEQAHVGDPTDAWTLYQRGRLRAATDDLEGAREDFVAALDRELFFPDVLAALGRGAYDMGLHDRAELFLERTLFLDPERPEVHALRGVNHLARGAVEDAKLSFQAALDAEPLQPIALSGLAWCAYAGGDSAKAITRFAELDDRRRALPEDDPYRVFAQAQIARIQDNDAKEIWTDRFERRRLKNGWDTEEAAGPNIELVDGALHIEGTFDTNGTVRFWRLLPAADFVSLEMDVTVASSNNTRVGVFIAKERRRGVGVSEVQGMVAVGREKHGALALMIMDTARAEPEWEDLPEVPAEPGEAVQLWWPADRPVRLRLERVGEGSEAYGRISVDGVIVREGVPMRKLSTSSNELRLGLFVEGQTGLPANVVVDDVEMVYRVGR